MLIEIGPNVAIILGLFILAAFLTIVLSIVIKND
jgi:hypothetical protein